MRILVAGAGAVGGELAAQLARAGHDVLALRRTRVTAAAPGRGSAVRWLACDLCDETALGALALDGIDALAYLVAADARADDSYRRAYVLGLAQLLARLRAGSSLKRVLFASSTSVYAQHDGGWVDEKSSWPEVTVDVAVGQMRAFEFDAIYPGDWAIHCHKSHHTMNAMGHDVKTYIGVDKRDLVKSIGRLAPGYMAMGETGMAEHAEGLLPWRTFVRQ